MLGWLISAVAPWVIHLWSRRRYRRTAWAAMEYLLAALRETQRRLRLEEWTLLAVRSGLIGVVVLALAEPFRTPQLLAQMTGQRVHRILVLDASLSMGYRPGEQSRWAEAKQLAGQLISRSTPSDGVSLILMADPPQVIVGPPVFDRAEILRELEGLRLRHTGADLSATLACVEQVLEAGAHHVPRMDRAEVYFLSDLCRVGWTPEFARPEDKQTFEHRLARIAQQAQLILIDLGQPGATNTAVSEVRLMEPYTAVGQTLHVEAVLRSFGQDRPGHPVELWVNGQPVQKTSVDLPADRPVSVILDAVAESPGQYVLEVRTGGDALPEDNRRFAVRQVKPVFRVLCVDGRPSGGWAGGLAGAADFLALALQPADRSSAALPLEPEIVPESALPERNLTDYDCLFLCNVGQLTRSEVRRLAHYVKRGGGLVVWLGDRVQAEVYNRLLAGGQAETERILPARLGTIVSQSAGRLDPLEYRHPILWAFRGRERAGLLTTPIFQYFRLERIPETQAQVVLASANGDPLILEEPLGQGRVVLVASSADTTWTAMPLWPSFVPLVQEMTAYAISGSGRPAQVQAGQSVGAIVSGPEAPVWVRLTLPEGQSVELRPRIEPGAFSWNYTETFWSGFYMAEYGPPLARQEAFAVNPDPKESDLAKLSEADLRQMWGQQVPFAYHTPLESVGTPPAAELPPQRVSQFLLHLALGLMVLESVLAWRMDNRREHTPPLS